MCYKEFIAYQCGHRSISVVRPCPLTTGGHNFPVCSIPPSKPHYAETMCAVCERHLHSRWVLIREWEHRWLHERGVCGCDVTFPGLLTTPRVIGGTSAASIATTERDGVSPTPKAVTASESSNDGQPGTSQDVAEKTAADSRVPALFSEGQTDSGQKHVTIRLSSLYAAEWQADHRAQHEAGKCSCPATFTPFQPQVGDNELTPSDRHSLRQWRDAEAQREKKKDYKRGTDTPVDDIIQRLAEIDKAFGKFKPAHEPAPAQLPRLGSATAADNQAVDARRQGNGNGQHYNRRFENRLERGPPTQPRGQLLTQVHHRPPQGQLVPAFPRAATLYGQRAASDSYRPAPVFHQAARVPTGYIYPEYAPHQRPHYFTPAYPAYATTATYIDAMPHGALLWAAGPQSTPGMPWVTQGPGPYRTPGFDYHHHGRNVQGRNHIRQRGPAPFPADMQLPAPATPEHKERNADEEAGTGAGADDHGRKGKEVDSKPGNGSDTGSRQDHHQHPLCGLPIGAGPEGTPHMPSWLDCPLRRSASMSVMAPTPGEEEEEEDEEEEEKETTAAGGQEEQDTMSADEDDRDKCLPTPLQQRRHSATA